MIRTTFALAVGTWAVFPALGGEMADKEVKLTGTLVCAKCKLKMDGVKKCTNALQVKEGRRRSPTSSTTRA